MSFHIFCRCSKCNRHSPQRNIPGDKMISMLESVPDGWTIFDNYKGFILCPECSNKYDVAVKKAIENVRTEFRVL